MISELIERDLEKHKFKIYEDHRSRCGNHVGQVHEIEGKVYDFFGCMIFKSVEQFKKYELY